MKTLLLWTALLVGGAAALIEGKPLPPDDFALSSSTVFDSGEELVYEVSWTFFKLGTIHIKTLGNFKAIAYIDSYDGVPFVDLHSVHYTEMDSTFHTTGAASRPWMCIVTSACRKLPRC